MATKNIASSLVGNILGRSIGSKESGTANQAASQPNTKENAIASPARGEEAATSTTSASVEEAVASAPHARAEEAAASEKPQAGNPRVRPSTARQAKEEERPSTERGTKPGETRATFIVNKEQLRKIKYISLIGNTSIKDEVFAAFEARINQWESENGKIRMARKKK